MWNRLSQAAGLGQKENEQQEAGKFPNYVELQEEREQQQILIQQLKELLRENETHLKNKEKEVEETTAKFLKFKLQAKAKITQLSAQLKSHDQEKKTGQEKGDAELDEVPPSIPDHGDKGKVLMLKKQLEESRYKFEQREKDVSENHNILEKMIEDLQNQLQEKDNVIQEMMKKEEEGNILKQEVDKQDNVSPTKQQNTDTQEMYAQLLYKDAKIVELNNSVLEKERQIIDLQEHIKEKEEVLQARNLAIQLMTEEMSKRGKTVIDELDETRGQMKLMQENFISAESGWKEEKEKFQKDLQDLQEKHELEKSEKETKIDELESNLKKLESVRFELVTKNAQLQEKVVYMQENLEKWKETQQKKYEEERNSLHRDLEEKSSQVAELKKLLDETNSETENKILKARVKERSKIKALERYIEELKGEETRKESTLQESLEGLEDKDVINKEQSYIEQVLAQENKNLMIKCTSLEEEQYQLLDKVSNLQSIANQFQEQLKQQQEAKRALEVQSEEMEETLNQNLEQTIKFSQGKESKVTELESSLEVLKLEKAALETKVREIEEQKTDGDQTIHQLKEKVNNLLEQVEDQKQFILDLEKDRNRAQVELEELKNSTELHRGKIPDLEKDLEATKKEMNELLNHHKTILEEKESLQEKLDATLMELNLAKQQISDTLHELEISQNSQRENKDTHLDLRKELDESSTQLSEFSPKCGFQSINEADYKWTEVQEVLTGMENEVDILKTRKASLEYQKSDLLVQQSQEEECFKTEKDQLKTELNEKDMKTDQLHLESSKRRTLCSELTHQLCQVKKDHEMLQELYSSEGKKTDSKVSSLMEQIWNLETEVSQIQKQLEEKDKSIESYQKQMEDSKLEKAIKVKDYELEIENNKRRIQNLERDICYLQSQLADFVDAVKSKDDKINEITREYENKTKHNVDQLQDYEFTVEKYKEENVQLSSEKSSLAYELCKSNDKIQELKQMMKENCKYTENLEDEINKSDSHLASLNEKLEKLQNDIEAKNQEIIYLKRSNEEAVKSLKQQLEICSKENSSLKENNLDLNFSLTQLQEQVNCLQDHIVELKSSNEADASKLSSLTNKYHEVLQKNCEIQEDYNKQYSKLQKAEQELQAALDLKIQEETEARLQTKNCEIICLKESIQEKETMIEELKKCLELKELEVSELSQYQKEKHKVVESLKHDKKILENEIQEKSYSFNILQTTIQNTEQENLQLKSEIEKLSEEVLTEKKQKMLVLEKESALQNNIEQLKNEVQTLQHSLQKSSKDLQCLESSVEENRVSKDEIEQQLQTKCDARCAELQEKLTEIENLKVELQILNKQLQDAKKTWEQLKEHEERHEVLFKENALLQERTNEMKVSIDQLSIDLQESNEVKNSLEQEVKRLNLELSTKEKLESEFSKGEAYTKQLSDSNNQLQLKVENLQQELNALYLRKEDMQSEIKTVIKNYDEQVAALEQKDEDNFKIICDLNKQLEEKEHYSAVDKKQIERLQLFESKYHDLTEKFNEKEEAYKLEVQQTKNLNIELQNNVHQLEEDIKSVTEKLKTEGSEKSNVLTALEKEVSEKKSIQTLLQEAQKTISVLENSVNDLQYENSEALNKTRELENKRLNLEEKVAEMEIVLGKSEVELTTTHQQLEEVKNRMLATQNENFLLNSNHQQLTEEKSELELAIHKIQDEKQQLYEQIQNYEDELRSFEHLNKKQKDELNNLKAKYEEMEINMQQKNEHIRVLQYDLSEHTLKLSLELESCHNQIQELQIQVLNKNQELEDAHQYAKKKDEKIKSINDELVELQNKLKETNESLNVYRRESENLGNSIVDKDNEISNLSERLVTVNSEISSISAEARTLSATLAEKEEDYNELNLKHEENLKKIESKDEEINILHSKMENLEFELQDAQNSLECSEKSNGDLKKILSGQENTIRDLEDQLSNQLEKNHHQENCMKKIKAEIECAKNEIQKEKELTKVQQLQICSLGENVLQYQTVANDLIIEKQRLEQKCETLLSFQDMNHALENELKFMKCKLDERTVKEFEVNNETEDLRKALKQAKKEIESLSKDQDGLSLEMEEMKSTFQKENNELQYKEEINKLLISNQELKQQIESFQTLSKEAESQEVQVDNLLSEKKKQQSVVDGLSNEKQDLKEHKDNLQEQEMENVILHQTVETKEFLLNKTEAKPHELEEKIEILCGEKQFLEDEKQKSESMVKEDEKLYKEVTNSLIFQKPKMDESSACTCEKQEVILGLENQLKRVNADYEKLKYSIQKVKTQTEEKEFSCLSGEDTNAVNLSKQQNEQQNEAIIKVEEEKWQESSDRPAHVFDPEIDVFKKENRNLKRELELSKIKAMKMLTKLKQFKDKNEKLQKEVENLSSKIHDMMQIKAHEKKIEECLKNKEYIISKLQKELATDLDIHKNTLQQMKNEKTLLQEINDEFTVKLKFISENIEILQKNIAQSNQQNKDLHHTVDKLEKEKDVLQNKCLSLESKYSKLSDDFEEEKTLKESLQFELHNLKEHEQMLLSDNESYQQVLEELGGSKQKLEEELRIVKETHCRSFRELEARYHDESLKLKNLENILQEEEDKYQKLYSNYVELKTKSDDAVLENSSLKERLIEFQKETDGALYMKQCAEEALLKSQIELESLKKAQTSFDWGMSENEDTDIIQIEVEKLQKEKEIQKNQLHEVNKEFVQKTSEEPEELCRRNKELNNKVIYLQKEQKQLLNELNSVRNELDKTVWSNAEEKQKLDSEIKELKLIVNEFMWKKETLQQKETSPCKLVEDFGEFSHEVFQKQFQTLQQELESSRRENEALYSEKAYLEAACKQLQETNHDLQKKDTGGLAQKQPLETQEKLQQELQQAMQSLHQQGLKTEALSFEVNQLLEEKNSLQYQLIQTQQDLQRKERELTEFHKLSLSDQLQEHELAQRKVVESVGPDPISVQNNSTCITNETTVTPYQTECVLSPSQQPQHAMLQQSLKTNKLQHSFESLDKTILMKQERQNLYKEYTFPEEQDLLDTSTNSEYHLLLGLEEPQMVPETNYFISRHVKTHCHRFRRWIRGRRNYCYHSLKQKSALHLLFYIYLLFIHLWAFSCRLL
ncbi:uncharacterized protein LOC143257820 [Tachypleus tridentatus]|uniref:uncharacterized protein LOC143257820 n=1 Tax=Tachypleus tridentatus TaxID=6853 RepID=UPI003FD06F64